MQNPFNRPCWGGPCTAKGMAEPGFCKCKEDAEEIALLRKTLGETARREAYANARLKRLQH